MMRRKPLTTLGAVLYSIRSVRSCLKAYEKPPTKSVGSLSGCRARSFDQNTDNTHRKYECAHFFWIYLIAQSPWAGSRPLAAPSCPFSNAHRTQTTTTSPSPPLLRGRMEVHLRVRLVACPRFPCRPRFRLGEGDLRRLWPRERPTNHRSGEHGGDDECEGTTGVWHSSSPNPPGSAAVWRECLRAAMSRLAGCEPVTHLFGVATRTGDLKSADPSPLLHLFPPPSLYLRPCIQKSVAVVMTQQ